MEWITPRDLVGSFSFIPHRSFSVTVVRTRQDPRLVCFVLVMSQGGIVGFDPRMRSTQSLL